MDLKTTFDGLVLNNPLMPAAGPLVGDAEKMLFLEKAGCGADGQNLQSVYPWSRWADHRLPAPGGSGRDLQAACPAGYVLSESGTYHQKRPHNLRGF